jgi:hypothetical protein
MKPSRPLLRSRRIGNNLFDNLWIEVVGNFACLAREWCSLAADGELERVIVGQVSGIDNSSIDLNTQLD